MIPELTSAANAPDSPKLGAALIGAGAGAAAKEEEEEDDEEDERKASACGRKAGPRDGAETC